MPCFSSRGGKAKVFFQPKNLNELKKFLQILPSNFQIFTIGLGSNTLIRDGGFEGVVLKLGNGFDDISYDKKNKSISAGSGTRNIQFAKFCLKNSISGYEFLVGIPGSIGGSLKMNSGCFKREISDQLISLTLINRFGKEIFLNKEEIKFTYRKSSLPNDSIIINANFAVKRKDKVEINKIMSRYTDQRKKNHPLAVRTGGSTFKNPKSNSAWKLVDSIGYRGKRFGGAKVSEKHSNFLVNDRNATSLEIELLGEDIKNKVYKEKGITLDWEIERIGKFVKI